MNTTSALTAAVTASTHAAFARLGCAAGGDYGDGFLRAFIINEVNGIWGKAIHALVIASRIDVGCWANERVPVSVQASLV